MTQFLLRLTIARNYLALLEAIWHCYKLSDNFQKLSGIARTCMTIARKSYFALVETF